MEEYDILKEVQDFLEDGYKEELAESISAVVKDSLYILENERVLAFSTALPFFLIALYIETKDINKPLFLINYITNSRIPHGYMLDDSTIENEEIKITSLYALIDSTENKNDFENIIRYIKNNHKHFTLEGKVELDLLLFELCNKVGYPNMYDPVIKPEENYDFRRVSIMQEKILNQIQDLQFGLINKEKFNEEIQSNFRHGAKGYHTDSTDKLIINSLYNELADLNDTESIYSVIENFERRFQEEYTILQGMTAYAMKIWNEYKNSDHKCDLEEFAVYADALKYYQQTLEISYFQIIVKSGIAMINAGINPKMLAYNLSIYTIS